MAILIKRYANRKLYNTETSRYITLKGIAKLLDEGREVRVIDNATGEDITQVALSQILVDNQRSREDPSDRLLTQILTRGGDALYDAIRKSVDDATDGLGEFQDRFRNFVKESESLARGERGFEWPRRGDGERRSPFISTKTPSDEPTRDDDRRSAASDVDSGGPDGIRNALRKVIRGAFEERDLPRRADLVALNENLERVANAVERLEALLEKRDDRAD